MSEQSGWEAIWRSGNIPQRYQSSAAPDATVVAWAPTLPPTGAILDLGCGVGRHTTYLGGRGFRMSGLDNSPGGVEMTRSACAERHIAFDGQVSDMMAIPWPDATFDGVLSTSTIHHHLRADLLRTLAEVRRVLRPGGMFLVDFASTNALDYGTLRGLAAAGQIDEVEPNTFIDRRPNPEDRDGYLPHHYCDEAEVRDLLRRFEMIDLREAAHTSRPAAEQHLVDKWVASVRRPLSG
jgi:tellurite methyltransferase